MRKIMAGLLIPLAVAGTQLLPAAALARVPAPKPNVAATAARAPHPSQSIDINFRCAKFKGELSWSPRSPTKEAFIEITEGHLHDPCAVGHAQLFIHWDTIDNPQNKEVARVNAKDTVRTPFHTEDALNNYKDIYVYVCALVREHDYHCSGHHGPGA